MGVSYILSFLPIEEFLLQIFRVLKSGSWKDFVKLISDNMLNGKFGKMVSTIPLIFSNSISRNNPSTLRNIKRVFVSIYEMTLVCSLSLTIAKSALISCRQNHCMLEDSVSSECFSCMQIISLIHSPLKIFH